MRRFLISALFVSLIAGCSSYKFSLKPHRIDVQQGNALDQENIARLKTGLNRSQVRFLLGTPLLDDPFHNNRWDYVYMYYQAGNLAEQRRVSLFFEGDTLVRIERDLPDAAPVAQASGSTPPTRPEAAAEKPAMTAAAEPGGQAASPAEPAASSMTRPAVAAASPESVPSGAKPAPVSEPQEPAKAFTVQASTPAVASATVATPAPKPRAPMSTATSIVPPLTPAKEATPPKDRHTSGELSLQPETDVAQIKPDVMPAFPEPAATATTPAAVEDQLVLKALHAWANAWSQRDDEAYFAAYDPGFIPQGGGSHADWVKRKRMLLSVARNIEVKIESPSVEPAGDGSVIVTFNQFYQSDSYRDAVVKQLRMRERDGRWLIVDEKVLSVLHGAKP